MKKILALLLCCMLVSVASATERTFKQMKEIAQQKLSSARLVMPTRSAAQNDLKCVLSEPTLNVYSNGGSFVVVSRDNTFPAVLAYGTGNFELDNMSDGTKWWLKAVQESMQQANNRRSEEVTYTAVEPLVTTKWGQWAPFDNYAPIFKKDKTKAPSGCVAIAMAQIMNFVKYPASAEFEGSYSISDDPDELTTVQVNSTYTWPYLDAYRYYYPEGSSESVNVSTTPSKGNAVAALCRDCGYAVNMQFNPSGSGAQTYEAAQAFYNKFQYPVNAVRYYYRNLYNEREWMDILSSELAKGYPIFYAGSNPDGTGGHAFVADGMDADGLVHINWGWNGLHDGYYAFQLLNPTEDSQYSNGQEIVIGIRPEPMEGDQYGSMVGSSKPFDLSYNNETKKMTIKEYGITNLGGKDIKGHVAIVFEHLTDPDNSDWLEFLDEDETLPAFWGWSEYEDEFDWEFAPGNYRVFLASMDIEHESTWQIGRAVALGEFYYEMTVDDNGTVTIGEAPVYEVVETGINTIKIKTSSSYSNRIYDLNGRMVGKDASRLKKGIYIINGKKVVK